MSYNDSWDRNMVRHDREQGVVVNKLNYGYNCFHMRFVVGSKY